MKNKLLFVLALMAVASAAAQEAPKEAPKDAARSERPAEPKPLTAYKLEFVLRELQDAKLVNTRNYMMIVDDGYRTSGLKMGSRVPVKDEKDFRYLDVGTNIGCHHASSQGAFVALDCSIELSSFALPEEKVTAGLNAVPVLNQLQSTVSAMVPDGKQTVIGIIDDPSSTKRYEIAVTATKLK